MNIANIIKFDTANAPGLSLTIFVSGCEHYCSECHNPETWDFNYGRNWHNRLDEIKEALKNPHIKNLVISGGDPLHPKNQKAVADLLFEVSGLTINKNIILYTGYTIEEIKNHMNDGHVAEVVSNVDYIIEGVYDRNNKTHIWDYRGSLNQRCFKITTEYNEKSGYYTAFEDISNEYFKEKVNGNN